MNRGWLCLMLSLALAAPAAAEYVVFKDGRHLKVREVSFRGERVEVLLAPRGRMEFAAALVRYVTIDSDVETPQPSAAALGAGGPELAAAEPAGWLEWTPAPLAAVVSRAARRHGLEPSLLAAVIKVESDFRPHAVSPRGARGLMQLMPATAADFGLEDPFEPEANVDAGSRYLKSLLERFGDPELALAAYNAGPGTVRRYEGVPPYGETRRYVRDVLALWRQADGEPGQLR